MKQFGAHALPDTIHNTRVLGAKNNILNTH